LSGKRVNVFGAFLSPNLLHTDPIKLCDQTVNVLSKLSLPGHSSPLVAEQTNSFPVALKKGDDDEKTRSCEENKANLQLTECSGVDRYARAGCLVIKDILGGTQRVRPARADAFTRVCVPNPATS